MQRAEDDQQKNRLRLRNTGFQELVPTNKGRSISSPPKKGKCQLKKYWKLKNTDIDLVGTYRYIFLHLLESISYAQKCCDKDQEGSGFFTDLDPDFKNPDPDPSVPVLLALIYSKSIKKINIIKNIF